MKSAYPRVMFRDNLKNLLDVTEMLPSDLDRMNKGKFRVKSGCGWPEILKKIIYFDRLKLYHVGS